MYNRVECIGVFAKSQKNKNKIKTMIRVRFRHCGCAALPLYAFGGDQVNGTIQGSIPNLCSGRVLFSLKIISSIGGISEGSYHHEIPKSMTKYLTGRAVLS